MNRTPNALAAATPLKDTSPAYPHVQPLKASLFFDSAKGLGDWRIFMSTTAVKDMRTYLRDKKIFKIILKKLRELSTGFFSDDNQKRLQGPSNGIPIFEAKLTNDLRLIYQIDMMTDFERNCETQGIRVYGIFTHAQMDNRMWASLSAQLNVRGSEYRRRIQFRPRPRTSGDNVFLPQSWPDSSIAEVDAEGANSISEVNEADRALLHQWLVLEKYSALSTALVNWILSDKDSAPLFSVSPHERDIIEHVSSCYVLGRSGTGKTTTMTFKMFGIERTVQMGATELESKPRQLFVTQSRVLAGRVKEYYLKFSEFLSSTTGIVQGSIAGHEHADDEGMDDPEDDEDFRDELPKRFSELQDHHFPLFLTFDKLCRLLETDLGIALARPVSTKEQKRAQRRYRIRNTDANVDLDDALDGDFDGPIAADPAGPSEESIRNSLVDFESFLNNYWPHFPEHLTFRLDPALVFSEILGVIKGSEEALQSGSTYLSQEVYFGLSERTRSTFAGHREKIYLLFEKYTALKREYGHFDLADRAHSIFQKLKDGYQFSVDYLYVDEVQDNLILDALVLRLLCCNPHGLFWAGDTAQTIAVGSSFRFDDLKASLYNFEKALYPFASENLVHPVFFQLTTNYRSHGGIVNCAGLIVELIMHFWPYSIDTLQKEKGIVDGAKPIFFTGLSDETARYEQFLLGETGSSVEFGAEQCILVRNDRARERLRKEVGEIGVILTLYESKGLEFDDVLLYDFFEDSSCNLSQWRVVLNFLHDPEGVSSAPRFDELHHAGLCTELKCLYVAITRARKNLWIMDRSDKGEPMKVLLLRNGKIEVRNADDTPSLAKSSTLKEWEKTGMLLFNNKRYIQAMHCFDRAGLSLKRDIAEAYHLRHQARNAPRSEGEQARMKSYKEAGSAFFVCAGKASNFRKRCMYYHISAECFREARDNSQAALAYENAEEYTDAARCYAKAVLFKDALRIVRTKKSIDRGTEARIISMARLHYVHVEELEEAMKLELFDCREQLLEYMEEYGFETTRAAELTRDGEIQEAADIYFREGDEDRAIRLLLEDVQKNQSLKSLKHATRHLLTCLWQQYPFGLDRMQRETKIIDPFHYVEQLDRAALPEEIAEELSMFVAMRRDDRDTLVGAYKKFLSAKRNNPQAAILILDYLITPDRTIGNIEEASQYLEACVAYVDIIWNIWTRSIPATNLRTQRLFGFRGEVDDNDKFTLIDHGTLATYQTERRSRSISQQVVNHDELRVIIKSFIKSRLCCMVQLQIKSAERIRDKHFRDLCLTHAIRGKCGQENCHRVHIDANEVDMKWFNIRVRIHLLQILFLQMTNSVLNDSRLLEGSNMIKWVTSLFNTLNPPLLTLGSSANISPAHIPEYFRGMKDVATWTRDRAYHITPRQFSWWFLSEVTEVSALALWSDKDRAARALLRRAPFYSVEMEMFVPIDGGRTRRFAVSNLVRSLDTLDPEFIKSGFLFIRDVMQFRLEINIWHLCRIVELVSAGSVLLHKSRVRRDFHNTLLPRSWLFSIVPKLDLDPQHEVKIPIYLLLRYATDLAHHLLVGPGGKDHLRVVSTPIVRFLAVQRILRAICLVAYNTSSRNGELVFSSVVKLREASAGDVPPLLWPFLSSGSWPALRRATERSVPRSDLDWMIQLVQAGRNPMSLSDRAIVTRLKFQGRNDLVTMFSQSREFDNSKPSPNTTVPVPVPASLPSVATSNQPTAAGEKNSTVDELPEVVVEVEDDYGDDEADDVMDRSTEIDIADENHIRNTTTALSGAEIDAGHTILRFFRLLHHRKVRAARSIQRRYRAILSRRRELEDQGLRGKRARLWKACVDVDLKRNKVWPTNGHRVEFLGILPDLLACLDALQSPIQSGKKKARKQLTLKSKDIDYEEVHLRLTKANTMRKSFEQLKRQLKETSDWHAERKLAALRNVVEEIVTLFDELKLEGIERDSCLEIRGLNWERKRRLPQKQPRPTLNTSDLDDSYHYTDC